MCFLIGVMSELHLWYKFKSSLLYVVSSLKLTNNFGLFLYIYYVLSDLFIEKVFIILERIVLTCGVLTASSKVHV